MRRSSRNFRHVYLASRGSGGGGGGVLRRSTTRRSAVLRCVDDAVDPASRREFEVWHGGGLAWLGVAEGSCTSPQLPQSYAARGTCYYAKLFHARTRLGRIQAVFHRLLENVDE